MQNMEIHRNDPSYGICIENYLFVLCGHCNKLFHSKYIYHFRCGHICPEMDMRWSIWYGKPSWSAWINWSLMHGIQKPVKWIFERNTDISNTASVFSLLYSHFQFINSRNENMCERTIVVHMCTTLCLWL